MPAQARSAAAAAREEAVELRDQVDTLQAQHGEFMEALKVREPKAERKLA
jgi:hypothetical protein